MPIDPATLDPDPIRQLAAWLADASATGLPLPNAFALATADDEGMPSVRFVLLNGLDADGLRYFTHRGSRKGRDVAINPHAAAAFWWPSLDRQVRVNGSVRLLSDADSLAYWRTRPRGSQLSATVSAQGQEVGSREELEARVAELAARQPWRAAAAADVGRLPHRAAHHRVLGKPSGPAARPRRVSAWRRRLMEPAPAPALAVLLVSAGKLDHDRRVAW